MSDTTTENVIGAAMLVATAFRLRDEEALLLMLRRLVVAVDEYTAANAPIKAAIAAAEGGQVQIANPSPAPLAKEALEEMIRNPRYWRDRDPEFVRRVGEGYRALYPE